ncbi:MAG: hypothetical protein KJ887_04865 [Candidatus Omnitrophica bacterium]|nr:hypothetical protein [Candidatus Omnitrophota bacterium]MBU1047054.1 hypothetical protein [Candidatus Omnitrophota bacterium]MBU1767041.1 hypothetical protein [Candidatus Omnitrophota bacterium]MBU1889276.1 hypothetical protein [Candidatus Omnitrophota bacterium]
MKNEHKYFKLYQYFKKSEKNIIELRKEDIDRILGFSLPSSAKIHSWWSNSPESGHSQAFAWVEAGFFVHIRKERSNGKKKEYTLTFRKFS